MVNCGAIPEELMEREFFGYIKGAYSGAHRGRKGYFEKADRGTIFLDKVEALDKNLQVKLLWVLKRGEIIRVGDSVPIYIPPLSERKRDILLVKNLDEKKTFIYELPYKEAMRIIQWNVGKKILAHAISEAGNNYQKAAQKPGMSRSHF